MKEGGEGGGGEAFIIIIINSDKDTISEEIL
jgi:hypothetical protein